MKMGPIQTQSANLPALRINYPIVILNVDISSFATKVIHFIDMANCNSQVQGSHLMERKKLQK